MKKNTKKFLTYFVTASIIIGGLIVVNEATTDHKSKISTYTKILYGLGLKNEAINYQINQIENEEGYSARYVEKLNHRYVLTSEIRNSDDTNNLYYIEPNMFYLDDGNEWELVIEDFDDKYIEVYNGQYKINDLEFDVQSRKKSLTF